MKVTTMAHSKNLYQRKNRGYISYSVFQKFLDKIHKYKH